MGVHLRTQSIALFCDSCTLRMWRQVFLGLTVVSGAFSQIAYTYRDQDDWPGLCNTGKAQSPINIDPHSRVDPKLKRLELRNYNEMLGGSISNEDGLLHIDLTPGIQGLPYVTGGLVGRGERYVFGRCVIIWGDSIQFGSDHRFGDEQFAGEFICYHYNDEKYSTLEEAEAASGDKKAMLAISWLFKETVGSGNSKWDEIFGLINPADLMSIAVEDNETPLMLKLSELIPQGKDYFYYQGSHITPARDCNEVVSRYIMKDTIPMTRAQHDLLTMVMDSANNDRLQNFRYPQKLNKRKVRAYKHHASRKGHGSHGHGYRDVGYKSHGHGFKGPGKGFGIYGHGYKGPDKFYGSRGYGPRSRGKGYGRHGHGYKGRGKGYGPPWW